MSFVLLEYSFIFDPSETWQQMSQLDSDLYSWLNEKGFDAELVETPQQEQQKRIIIIKKSKEIIQPEVPKSVNKQISQLAPNRDFNGRYKDGRSSS